MSFEERSILDIALIVIFSLCIMILLLILHTLRRVLASLDLFFKEYRTGQKFLEKSLLRSTAEILEALKERDNKNPSQSKSVYR